MSTKFKEIPKSEMPRERLVTYGVKNLSNEELLSILLRTGVHGNSVSDLSKEILCKIKDIHHLKDINLNTLKSIRGLGLTKSVTILAALELGKRVYESDVPHAKLSIVTPIDSFRYFAKYIIDDKQENLLAIFVDQHRQYLTHKIIFKGTLTSSIVHPREIFKMALLENAAGVIVMHNHPSGVLRPSKADDATTQLLIEAGSTLDIRLLDHVIVGNHDYYSYVEEGRLKFDE